MYPTTVTVPAGVVVRKYEQTASRDHQVELIPGTYPVTLDKSPEGFMHGIHAAIPAIAKPHTASTVEFGGVALASEQRGGERETWSFHAYTFQIDQWADRFTFGYAERENASLRAQIASNYDD